MSQVNGKDKGWDEEDMGKILRTIEFNRNIYKVDYICIIHLLCASNIYPYIIEFQFAFVQRRPINRFFIRNSSRCHSFSYFTSFRVTQNFTYF